MIYNSDKDFDSEELLICPRCKIPVSVLPDLTNPGREIYFCYRCNREVEPIEDDDGADEARQASMDWQPEFAVASAWSAWAFAVGLLVLVLVAFCRAPGG
jgi:hypothetical protein